MQKSSLLQIIYTFSKEDYSKFEDFVKSPYHNKNSNAVKLFLVIKKYSEKNGDNQFTKEWAWKKAFPAKKYNYGIMKNLIHCLTGLAEEYLADVTSKNDFIYKKYLIEGLRQRNLNGQHKKALKRLNSEIDKLHKDEFYFDYKIIAFQKQIQADIDKKLSDKIKVDLLYNDLCLFVLRYTSGLLNLFIEEQRTSIRHDNKNIMYFTEFLNKNIGIFKNENIVLIYCYLFNATVNLDDDGYYNSARNAINKYLPILDYTDKRNVYNVLIAICIRKHSLMPRRNYMAEISKLHIEMIQYSLLGEPVNILTYRNILILCLSGKNKILVRELIQKYLSKVSTSVPEALENYSNAFLFFINEDFKKCLEHCLRINFGEFLDTAKEGFWFKNDIKSIELRCYYELNLPENLITASDAYSHFLSGSILMNKTKRESELNFNKYLRKLTVLKIDNNIREIRSLKNNVHDCENTSNREWLLEKCTVLENQNTSV